MIPAPLSIRTGGRTSSTLRPQWVRRPAASALAASASIAARAASSSGAPRQWNATIAPLSSSRTRRRRRSDGVRLATELVDPAHPVLDPRIEHRLGPAGPQQLGPVRAQVGDRPDRHHRARLRGAPPADAGDDAVAARDLDQQLPRRPPARARRRRARRSARACRRCRAGSRRVGIGAQRGERVGQGARTARRLVCPLRAMIGAMSDPRAATVTRSRASMRWARATAFARSATSSSVTAFGINALVLPPGYETGIALPRAAGGDLLRPPGRGRDSASATDSKHRLGPGGVARVDPGTHRSVRNVGDTDAIVVVAGGKDGYVGRDGQAVGGSGARRSARSADEPAWPGRPEFCCCTVNRAAPATGIRSIGVLARDRRRSRSTGRGGTDRTAADRPARQRRSPRAKHLTAPGSTARRSSATASARPWRPAGARCTRTGSGARAGSPSANIDALEPVDPPAGAPVLGDSPPP